MSDDDRSTPPVPFSKQMFEDLLAKYALVRLAVVFHPDIIIPDHLRTPKWTVGVEAIPLEYGLDMAKPIPDLTLTDKGIRATLSFSGAPYHTFVPWAAVAGGVAKYEKEISSPRPKLKLVP